MTRHSAEPASRHRRDSTSSPSRSSRPIGIIVTLFVVLLEVSGSPEPIHPSPAAVLGGDPTAHVLGAVDDLGTIYFSAREKPHRLTIDERDVLQVENDAIVRHGREQLLQPLRVLDVEHSAEDENACAVPCGLVDSIGHV